MKRTRTYSESSDGVGQALVFAGLLLLLMADRVLNLQAFGFRYTDIDQVILWNGASDYAAGVFHGLFFYGQAYNYMIEAVLAVPLLWMGVPVYQALPAVSALLAVFPFVVIAFAFLRARRFFWACVFVAFPVCLPIGFTMLSSLPRGFLQAHLFLPFVVLPMLGPDPERRLPMFFVFSSLAFVANPSSLLLIVPVGVWLMAQGQIRHFLRCSLLFLPLVLVDLFVRFRMSLHPERIVFEMGPLHLESGMLLRCLRRGDILQDLFPFVSQWGFLYLPLFFILMIGFLMRPSKRPEVGFVIAIMVFLLFTFFMPKVQEFYEGAGIFYHSSRFYLTLPLLFLLVFYRLFADLRFHMLHCVLLLTITACSCFLKHQDEARRVGEVVAASSFPVISIDSLRAREHRLQQMVLVEKADLIIHADNAGWPCFFDAYTYSLFSQKEKGTLSHETTSVLVKADRRYWLYEQAGNPKTLLLNGMMLSDSVLRQFDYKRIDASHTIVYPQGVPLAYLMRELGITYGPK